MRPVPSALLFATLLTAGCFGSEPLEPGASDAPDPALSWSHETTTGAARAATETAAVGLLRLSEGRSFEPTLGVTYDGVLFLSSYDPRNWLTSGQGARFLQRSDDGGHTWEDVTPRLPTGTSFPPQTNDPYVHLDPDTDRVFLSNLILGACSTLSWTDDLGASWSHNPVGCGHPIGTHDHQTVFTSRPREPTLPMVGYGNLVWYCVNRVADVACATSHDGGRSFGPLRPLVYDGTEGLTIDPGSEDPAHLAYPCHTGTAHGEAGPDGTVYLPRAHCGHPTVAITRDDGTTWQQVVIDQTIPVGRIDGHTAHEVPFAVDEAGNTYAAWIGEDLQLWLATSTDGGTTWAPPLKVNPPHLQSIAIPTLAAGAEGRIALAYYGTNATPDEAGEGTDVAWHGHITILTDVLSPAPTAQTVQVNPPHDPLARGASGDLARGDCRGRCSGIGDFIDIVIDADGRPWAAFVDVCVRTCSEAGGTENDGSLGVVGTLATGPALRGPADPLPPLRP